jgi:hypothetical protein
VFSILRASICMCSRVLGIVEMNWVVLVKKDSIQERAQHTILIPTSAVGYHVYFLLHNDTSLWLIFLWCMIFVMAIFSIYSFVFLPPSLKSGLLNVNWNQWIYVYE